MGASVCISIIHRTATAEVLDNETLHLSRRERNCCAFCLYKCFDHNIPPSSQCKRTERIAIPVFELHDRLHCAPSSPSWASGLPDRRIREGGMLDYKHHDGDTRSLDMVGAAAAMFLRNPRTDGLLPAPLNPPGHLRDHLSCHFVEPSVSEYCGCGGLSQEDIRKVLRRNTPMSRELPIRARSATLKMCRKTISARALLEKTAERI